MAGNFQRRLSGLEKRLVIGDDQREFLRLVRRCYNMQLVSDLALFVAGVCALLGEDEPDWVTDEMINEVTENARARLGLEFKLVRDEFGEALGIFKRMIWAEKWLERFHQRIKKWYKGIK